LSNIRNKIVSGLAWSSLAKIFTQLLSWVSTFFVIRYLEPNDYGLIGLAFAFLGFFAILSEFGLADALIQKTQVSLNNFSQIFTITFLLNCGIFLLLWASSEQVALYYKNDALELVLKFVAGNLLLSSFIVIPESMMNKEMLFKQRALIETVASMVNTLITLSLAIYGAGYWSILIGQFSNTLVKVIFFNLYGESRFTFTRDFSGFSSFFHFGFFTFISRAIWSIYNRVDAFIVGRVFGIELLGIYSVALQVASMPLDKISGTVNQVAFSSYSQNNINKEQENLFKPVRIMAVVIFPLFFGIAAISPFLIPLLIGDKWMQSILLIQILSVAMPFKLISSFLSTYILSLGKVKLHLFNTIIYFVFVLGGVLIGSLYSLQFMIICLVSATIIGFFITSYRILKEVDFSYFSFIFNVLTPVLCAIIMWIIIYFVMALSDADTGVINLFICVFIGVVAYSLLSLLLCKGHIVDITQELRLGFKNNISA